MSRINSEGIKRDDLAWVLTERRFVIEARKLNKCLLCKKEGVLESGLCNLCYSMLDGDELLLAEKWHRGTGP